MKIFPSVSLDTRLAKLQFGYAQRPTSVLVHDAWSGAWESSAVEDEQLRNRSQVHWVATSYLVHIPFLLKPV